MKRFLALAILAACTAVSGSAVADCDLSDVVGYTLVARKTIAGYVDRGYGKLKKGDDFEGCDFDRVIVFDDDTGLRCAGYSYSYAYRPEAYIFARSVDWKMCVDGEFYDMTPLR